MCKSPFVAAPKGILTVKCGCYYTITMAFKMYIACRKGWHISYSACRTEITKKLPLNRALSVFIVPAAFGKILGWRTHTIGRRFMFVTQGKARSAADVVPLLRQIIQRLRDS